MQTAAQAGRRWRAASASSVELISPREAGERFPLLRTDDLAGRALDSRRRQGQPGRPDACRSPRARATAACASSRASRSPACSIEHGRVAGVRTARGRGRAARSLVNCAGQWARQFGAPGRRQRAAVFGRAFLHRHRPHRRRAPDAAGDARPRRLHLLQGRGRRPGHGRLRARRPSRGRSTRSRRPSSSSCSTRTGTSSRSLMTNAIHRTPCLETARRSRCC